MLNFILLGGGANLYHLSLLRRLNNLEYSKFKSLISIKTIFLHMIGSFTNVWFCNTCIGHLENIGPLSYAELANVGASLCNIKKNHNF